MDTEHEGSDRRSVREINHVENSGNAGNPSVQLALGLQEPRCVAQIDSKSRRPG